MKRSLSILMAACMTASLLTVNGYAAENVTVTPTDITADRVVNYEGFGSITIDDIENGETCYGLVNRDQFVFPYSEGNYSYYVYDDVISYVGEYQYFTGSDGFGNWNLEDAIAHQPRYYDLNGNRLFEQFTLPDVMPEGIELNALSESGFTISDWGSKPMINGHAEVQLNCYPDAVGGNLVAFIDKTGKVTCILDTIDPSFNTPNASECKWTGWFGDNGWIAYGGYNENFPEVEKPVLGYLDAYGQTVLDVSHMGFTSAWPFAEGLSVVQDKNGLCGAIDTSGNLVIPCMYQMLGSISDGILIACSLDGKWGYIDKTGQTVIPLMYDHVYGWADGLGAVVLDDKCGLVDAGNNIVLPLEYDDITSFKNGVCYGIKDRKLYVITR